VGILFIIFRGKYMTDSKVKKLNLDEEVLKLRNAGLGYQEIAEALHRNHTDVDISHMAVKRFLDSHKVDVEIGKIDEGIDTWENLRVDFRNKMDDLEDETQEIYLIMKRSLKNIITEGDDVKTIKAARDTLAALDQQKKNWIDVIQWGISEFKPREKAQTLNLTKVNNMFVQLSDKLCPKCRSEIVDMVLESEKEVE
jgi:hypothetical protein